MWKDYNKSIMCNCEEIGAVGGVCVCGAGLLLWVGGL